MANQKPRPLAAPRSPGDPVEIKFVKEQASVFYALVDSDPNYLLTHMLLPACDRCGSDNIYDLPARCELACVHCGRKMSSTSNLRAGRIARR